MTLKSYKSDFNHSYSFGVFPTLELAINNPQILSQVIISSKASANSGVHRLLEICRLNQIPVSQNDPALSKLGAAPNAYAMGVFNKFTSSLDPKSNHIVLVSPQDMGNLGSIVRTLVGFNFHNLALIKPAVDIFDPKVIRSSMGAIFKINFSYFESFTDYSQKFKANYYPFMTNAKASLPNTNFTSPYSLIFGSESDGLPEEFSRLGTPVVIPHTKGIDSLNLSSAVAIAAYAAYTQN